jgi:hypothetical protein
MVTLFARRNAPEPGDERLDYSTVAKGLLGL